MNAPMIPTVPVSDETCVRKSRCENRWTAAEDKVLLSQVLKANGRSICWRSVAAALPGRNNKSCRKRWIHSLNPGLRKGRWTPAEDIALTNAVKVHGKHWFQVARMLGNGRTDDQCAKRWREALDPGIKRGPWAEHEDDKLITMFRTHGRKWNDIAVSLDGRPPVQCRNRWLSLVRAGKIEDDAAVKPEHREDPFFYLSASSAEAAHPATFENPAGGNPTPIQFPLRRTIWEEYQTSASYDDNAGKHQLYPPTYPEGQYHEQHLVLPNRAMSLIGPGYYPSSQTVSYSPSPHGPTEEMQPVHVVAPTPVNLVIQTNFTRVEHNYYATQESDTSSGYRSTPPPTTTSSIRSSFSFSSADSPTSPFDQTQEHTVHHASQGHQTTHGAYLPFPLRRQYEPGHYYQQPSPSEHGTSPYQGSPDGGAHQHGAYYPPTDSCEPSDYSCGYDSEPESDGGWTTYPVPSYQVYATQNPAAEAWGHPTWAHAAVTKSYAVGSDGTHNDTTNCLGFVGHPVNCNESR